MFFNYDANHEFRSFDKAGIMKAAWRLIREARANSISEALRTVWAYAKNLLASYRDGSYEAADAAREAAEEAREAAIAARKVSLDGIKSTLLWMLARNERGQFAYECVSYLANHLTGFGADVAKTVAKFRKISEKQAYVIARAAVEQNQTSVFAY